MVVMAAVTVVAVVVAGKIHLQSRKFFENKTKPLLARVRVLFLYQAHHDNSNAFFGSM